MNSSEENRLVESRNGVAWKKWGCYLIDRQWGTVREDYSPTGDAWDYFSHDQSRSRAYRWGEDGLAGISDNRQFLCFAIALWNGADPIIKERLFEDWNPSDGTILEFAEANDIYPDHSCRIGVCGTCMCKISEGEVDYEESPSASVDSGSVLICISKPKTARVVLDI